MKKTDNCLLDIRQANGYFCPRLLLNLPKIAISLALTKKLSKVVNR